jgi:hypothetical protein
VGDRLSLAASSLASEEREDIGSLVRQYQRTMGRTFLHGEFTAWLAIHGTSQNSSRGGYQTGEGSQFSHLVMGNEDPAVE